MSRLSPGFANEAPTLEERVVDLAAATHTLDPAKHANRLLTIAGGAVPTTINLPKTKGSGDVYRFLVLAAQTSGSIVINATHDGTSNKFVGTIFQHGSANLFTKFSSTVNDIITLNGTTQGGVAAGDYLELIDVAVGTWQVVNALFTTSGAQATPFSG